MIGLQPELRIAGRKTWWLVCPSINVKNICKANGHDAETQGSVHLATE
eukprot:s4125_g1.t1